jgi:hypothetical protein
MLLHIGGEEGTTLIFTEKLMLFPANLQPTIQTQNFVYLKSSIEEISHMIFLSEMKPEAIFFVHITVHIILHTLYSISINVYYTYYISTLVHI